MKLVSFAAKKNPPLAQKSSRKFTSNINPWANGFGILAFC